MSRLILLFGALLCALASVYAFSWAVDEYDLWQMEEHVGRWDAAGAIDDDRALAAHITAVGQIIARRPAHPRAHLLAARLYEWLAYLQRINPRHEREQLTNAERHLLAAISDRPFWGRAWGALAVVSAKRDRAWTPLVQSRFDTALRLGRYDSDTQLYLVNISLTQWQRMPEAARETAAEFLRQTLPNDGPAMDYVRRSFRHPAYREILSSIGS